MVRADDVLNFWLDKVGPAGWYAVDPKLDEEIRDNFLPAWEQARDGGFSLWLTYPTGSLAYVILLDQLSRNMFRGDSKSFEMDEIALAAAKSAIDHGWDLRIDEPARQFFYLPLMHSEDLCDQERCVRLMTERMSDAGASNLLHAKAHRQVIRKFGRFPYRNAALERRTTQSEQAFIDEGGYGRTVQQLQTA